MPSVRPGEGYTVGFDNPGDHMAVRISARECLMCHAWWLRCGTVIERRSPRSNYKKDPVARAAVVAAVQAEAASYEKQAASLVEDAKMARALAERIDALG
jgi:hypothetical protein